MASYYREKSQKQSTGILCILVLSKRGFKKTEHLMFDMLLGYVLRNGVCINCNLYTLIFNFLLFRGIGIKMTEPVYLSPSFDNVLPSYLFLQVSICKSDIETFR